MTVTLDPKYGEFKLVQYKVDIGSEGDFTVDVTNVEVVTFSFEEYTDTSSNWGVLYNKRNKGKSYTAKDMNSLSTKGSIFDSERKFFALYFEPCLDQTKNCASQEDL